MKRVLILLLLCICSIQTFHSQEDDGVVSVTIPTRNSLTFNRFAMNPTFSFVREQTKYFSIYNKREWVQFDNAPTTYLASYSGRFGENIGAGLGVFQQDYGVLTTFGGLLNFAYNVRLGYKGNLTFGLNIGAYKSGVNTANVVTNFDDPSLQNVPENFLLTVNPGINYGLEFLDFGVAINNLVLYNFKSSELIEDNQEQSIQAYAMYTGYMDSKGFFEDSKFTGLISTEFNENRTTVSVKAMITVPKGIWAQIGFNPLYGASGGVGVNITKQIALEYNYETALGDLSIIGPSHDITLAYRFKNNKYYDYSREDEMSSVFSSGNKKRRNSKSSKSKVSNTKKTDVAKAKAKVETDAEAKSIAAQKVKTEADAKAKLIEEQKAENEAQAKLIEAQKVKDQQDAQALLDKAEDDNKAKAIAETRARLQKEQEAKEKAEAKLLADKKEEAEAQERLIEIQKAKEESEKQAQLIAEQKAQQEAQAKIAKELAEEQKAQQEAEEKAFKERETQAIEDNAKAQLIAQKRADSIAKIQEQALLIEEQNAKQDAIANPKDDIAKSMQSIVKSAEVSKIEQNELLKQFDDIVVEKDKDLKDLKEENDLSDQGIAVKARPFKSVSAQNNKLNLIKAGLENVIYTQTKKIEELNALYEERLENKIFAMDDVTLYYKKEIDKLKSEQLEAKNAKAKLDARLESIKVAEEFEKRRRIKRAEFNNEDDRYSQDRATLKNIKQTTPVSDIVLKEEDFDFGEVQSSNIQILKNIKNVESGYYIIIAVHSDAKRRNDFVTKVVASGRTDVDFIYDVKTSKYYIYYDKFDNIENANNALKSKGNRPYNGNMSIVKIEN